mmetsp:Transcript_37992/g.94436  ORF Transcript_37992/g.94436 Transcript_37992/m.94436 type:complete len:156 (-) Transcript_37992:52-519(-)
MMLALQSSLAAPALTPTGRLGRHHASPWKPSAAFPAARRRSVVRAEADTQAAEAPGEGKRRRPGSVDEDLSHLPKEALEPVKGPRVTSKGIAPDEVEPVLDAFKLALEVEFPAADAPGEGKRRGPAPTEFPDSGGKPPRPLPKEPRMDPVKSSDE